MSQQRKNPVIIWVIVAFFGFIFLKDIVEERNETTSYSSDYETTPADFVFSPEPEVPKRPFPPEGYIIEFGEDFNPGLTYVDDLGISIVIAVDVSGSMGDPPSSGGSTPKYQLATKALSSIVTILEKLLNQQDQTQTPIKVGVVTFSNKVRVLSPITPLDKENITYFRSLLGSSENFKPGGQTALGWAIEVGAEMLVQSGTILKSLIIVSDGENTVHADPTDSLFALYGNRNNFSTVEYPVTTNSVLVSIVGFDVDASWFWDLETHGARVTSASNTNELSKSLNDFLIADITKLEAGRGEY